MKCERCGATLPENSIRCVYCGATLQMVPDYNPLGDVIEDEVRNALQNDALDTTTPNEPRRERHTGRLNQRSTERIGERQTDQLQEKQHEKSKETRTREQEIRKKREQEKRRESERRRALKKKKRNIVLGSIIGVCILLILAIYVRYSNSYQGQLNKGLKAAEEGQYYAAIECLENAISKNPNQEEAYIALSTLYNDEGDAEEAESILLDAINTNPDSLELNRALINLYIENDNMEQVNIYMSTLTDSTIKETLSNYEASIPEFSLEEGTYEDVQEVSIISEEGSIYYTTDGTEATKDSELYTGAIQIGEGTTEIRAISVNSEGVPSYENSAEYTVEFPMESAPVVSPTTGRYTEEMTITITVPAGYTAFYTLDNTTPTIESTVYTEPIAMPEGNTIFTAVLMNSSGKYSDITKRNYNLILEEEEEDEEEAE